MSTTEPLSYHEAMRRYQNASARAGMYRAEERCAKARAESERHQATAHRTEWLAPGDPKLPEYIAACEEREKHYLASAEEYARMAVRVEAEVEQFKGDAIAADYREHNVPGHTYWGD